MRAHWFVPIVLLLAGTAGGASTAAPPGAITLAVDATDVSRRILHMRLAIPVTGGPLTLAYPKWIPGEHGPTGPIVDLVGLKISAAGRPVLWRRDAEDMWTFQMDVPAGTTKLDASYDFVISSALQGFTSASAASAQVLIINWNQLVLYPAQMAARDVNVAANVVLPAGWNFGTALPVATNTGSTIRFAPASLETLVDSPVVAGAFFRTLDLSPGATPSHVLHLAGDSAAAIDMSQDILGSYRQLVREANALFGAPHYRGYHFLFTLSDHVAHFGVEHHESSDNRLPERTLLEEGPRVTRAGLLPHEMVHSWNGKYRRPAGMVTPDFGKALHTDLLWVYEGLTMYLGEVLTGRSGLRTPAHQRESLALTAATQDMTKGRIWRPLVDTAIAAQIQYGAPAQWRAWRRGVDFYRESQLIWLEADVLIRNKTGGQKSLDDFCRAFHGGQAGPPSIKPYTFEDIVAGLRAVLEYDWRTFLNKRVNETNTEAPLLGIAASGWNLVYKENPSSFQKLNDQVNKTVDLTFSVGLLLREDGTVVDVVPGLSAAQSGIAPSMKVVAVNGRRFGRERVQEAVRATKTRPLELLVENGDFFKNHKLKYTGGARNPTLERNQAQPDLLTPIFGARTTNR